MLGESHIIGNYDVLLTTNDFYLVKVLRNKVPGKRQHLVPNEDLSSTEEDTETKHTETKQMAKKTRKAHHAKKTRKFQILLDDMNNRKTQRNTSVDYERAKLQIDSSCDVRDVFSFKNTNVIRDNKPPVLTYYAMDGSIVSNRNTSAFVARSDGVVLSPHYQGLMLCCLNSEKHQDARFVVGRVDAMRFGEKGHLEIACTWLTTETKRPIVEKYLPVKCALISCTLLPFAMKSHLAPDHTLALSAWETQNTRHLKSCVTLDSVAVSKCADMYDYLEFYHSTEKFLWRTCLGMYIYQTFIEQRCKNATQSQMGIVGIVLQTPDLVVHAIPNRKPCNFCGEMTDVNMWKTTQTEMNIGTECCHTLLSYLFGIGVRIHRLRCEEFNAANAFQLIPRMETLQKEYYRQSIVDAVLIVKNRS